MKIQELKSSTGITVAVQVLDNYGTISPNDFISLVKQYGIVVWKKQDITSTEYVDFQKTIGYHQPAEMWCNDPNHPEIFRVTNKKINDLGDEGLFSHGELDWHCNLGFTPDSEEMISLRCITSPKGSITSWTNSMPYWNSLDSKTKKDFESYYIHLTNEIENTYEKKLLHYMLPIAEKSDFDKQRKSRSIQNAINFDQDLNLYPEPRFTKDNYLRLHPNHPLGMKGIYFPHLNMEDIGDVTETPLSNHKNIYKLIRKAYIDMDDYHYHHEWDEGDILFADQFTGVHKRNNVWEEQGIDSNSEEGLRYLERTAFWYKTHYRTHTGRCL
jgi:alpha-ketoglutarate-dependent taurine dioxygenase